MEEIKILKTKFDKCTSTYVLLQEIEDILDGCNSKFNNKINDSYYYDQECVSIDDVFRAFKQKLFQQMMMKIWCESFIDTKLRRVNGNYRFEKLLFDSKEKVIKLNFYDKSQNKEIKCIFDKRENGQLYMKNSSEKLFETMLLLQIGEYLNTFYSGNIDNSTYISKEKIKSVNCKFLLDLCNFKIYYPDLPNFSLECTHQTYNSEYKISSGDSQIDKVLQKETREICKKIFVRIEECPMFLKEDLIDMQKRKIGVTNFINNNLQEEIVKLDNNESDKKTNFKTLIKNRIFKIPSKN